MSDIRSCIVGCVGQGQPCVNRCAGRMGFSDSCAECMGSMAACTAENCKWTCTWYGNNSPRCSSCVVNNCYDSLERCSGVPKEDLPTPGAKLVSSAIDAASGKCTSQKDLERIEEARQDPTKMMDDIRGCLIGCVGQDQSCVTRCAANMGFSSSCAECMGDMAMCTKDSCKWTCTWYGNNSPRCHNCVVNHCYDSLARCSGVPKEELPRPGSAVIVAQAQVAGNGCTSQKDLKRIEEARQDPDQMMDDVRGCLIGCVGQGQSCVTSCAQNMGFSSSCAECMGNMATCTATNCKWTCTWYGNNSPRCSSCVVNNCYDSLARCSGVPKEDLPTPGAKLVSSAIDAASGKCTSQKDLERIEEARQDPTKMMDDIRGCLIGCVGQDQSCVTRCAANMGFSSSCAECMGDMAMCTKDSCKWTCTWYGNNSPRCHNCVVNHCYDSLARCSGVPMEELPRPGSAEVMALVQVAGNGCTSQKDLERIEEARQDPDQMMDDVRGCLIGCVGKGQSCVTSCAQNMGFSSSCAEGMGNMATCTATNCKWTCTWYGNNSPRCSSCVVNNCYDS